ncbi:MAG: hypothetical protein CM1200mP34_1680 [Verrucomicrobiales bacterium]|nr:MAG: hypothetical protein CM1200mP34_1680 [Verrucomicrobiales bacterium]
MWGGNPSIGRVSTAIYIALEAGHPSACFLGDVYHTYKGGSDFDALKMLGPQALQVFHWNDYPADPPLDKIGDGDRVFPGDGFAPITDIVNGFLQVGAAPALSLELFNRTYWAMDAIEAAKVGLSKMKPSVALRFKTRNGELRRTRRARGADYRRGKWHWPSDGRGIPRAWCRGLFLRRG